MGPKLRCRIMDTSKRQIWDITLLKLKPTGCMYRVYLRIYACQHGKEEIYYGRKLVEPENGESYILVRGRWSELTFV